MKRIPTEICGLKRPRHRVEKGSSHAGDLAGPHSRPPPRGGFLRLIHTFRKVLTGAPRGRIV